MMLATLLTTLSLLPTLPLPLTAPAPLASPRELPYHQLAEHFLASKGLAEAAPAEQSPKAVLATGFLHTPIGLFDVWSPVDELRTKDAATDHREVCIALCQAQERWLEWVGEGANGGEALRADLAELREWIAEWDVQTLREAHDRPERTTLDLFDADEPVRVLAADVAERFRKNQILGAVAGTSPRAVELALMPTRAGFIEFIAYAGEHLRSARGSFWHSGIQTWSQFTLEDLNVIALEYASPTARPGEYTAAYDMNTKSPTGLQEQVVQLAMNELLAHQHRDALPPGLISGLAINLVTDLYGACHSRVDGDTSSKVTNKREVFVRGGQPQGGILPPNSAESRWRQEYGRKHYAPILKQTQKAGAGAERRSKNKLRSFLLQNESGSETYLTHAPLLGPSAGEVEVVPDAVYGDYLEFTRAYRAAFLYWLQHHADRSKKKAATKFSAFLGGISGDLDSPGLAEVAEAVYGFPLSDAEVSTKSLEGRFLKWISRQ